MPVRYSGFDYDGCVGVTNLINIVAQNPKLVQRIRETSNYYTKEVALILRIGKVIAMISVMLAPMAMVLVLSRFKNCAPT
ncbi:TPA: hypothetical protein JBE66_05045 [Legionella pneumophila]|nr:hypothetical protein [Legionella pneumophila]HAU0068926.1 hypothetical protein [Legionella pneumophila]HBD7453189.1 hypothetical protein [Legionella pneumophila]